MSAQHMPGPWEARRDDDGEGGEWLVFGPNGLSLADCAPPWGDQEVHEANARLIAAAPDLLEVAKFAEDFLAAEYAMVTEPDNPAGWSDRAAYENYKSIHAAIAKATGGGP
jgi:hypothetical protein